MVANDGERKNTRKAVNRVLAYLVGTMDFKLWVPRRKGTVWDFYADSDHAGDKQETTRSQSTRHCFRSCPGRASLATPRRAMEVQLMAIKLSTKITAPSA